MDQRMILFLFRILICFAIDLECFISCGRFALSPRGFVGLVALKHLHPEIGGFFVSKNVNK